MTISSIILAGLLQLPGEVVGAPSQIDVAQIIKIVSVSSTCGSDRADRLRRAGGLSKAAIPLYVRILKSGTAESSDAQGVLELLHHFQDDLSELRPHVIKYLDHDYTRSIAVAVIVKMGNPQDVKLIVPMLFIQKKHPDYYWPLLEAVGALGGEKELEALDQFIEGGYYTKRTQNPNTNARRLKEVENFKAQIKARLDAAKPKEK